LHPSPHIIKLIKSRWVRRAGYVAHMGTIRNDYKVLVKRPERRDHLKDLGVDGRILLNVKRADAD